MITRLGVESTASDLTIEIRLTKKKSNRGEIIILLGLDPLVAADLRAAKFFHRNDQSAHALRGLVPCFKTGLAV